MDVSRSGGERLSPSPGNKTRRKFSTLYFPHVHSAYFSTIKSMIEGERHERRHRARVGKRQKRVKRENKKLSFLRSFHKS